MITFILIFAGLIILGAAYFLATGATQREAMAGESHAQSQQTGAGAPTVGRPTGNN